MNLLKQILLIGCLFFFCTACESNKNANLNIVTTAYPIRYITEKLYGNGNIISLYPDGADTTNYQLTQKQIKDYSNNDLFIYNGLSNELNIAKNLVNSNRRLHIIDVAYGLKFANGIEELWLSPNYFLMLTTTIKNNLLEIINNKYINDEIEKQYKEMEEVLSIMDAELRNLAKEAQKNNKETIIVSSNLFKYLDNYGFHVISLEEEENLTSSNLNVIKNNFKNNTYSTIFIKENEEKSAFIATLEKEAHAKVVPVKMMNTLSVEEQTNKENYLTIMESYIENIKLATIGE